MPDQRARIVVQAHALRAAAALAVLLHGTARSVQEQRRPMSAIIGGAVLALVLLIAVFVATKVGTLISAKK